MRLDPGRHGGAAGVSVDDTASLSGLQAPDVTFDTSASFASAPAWLPFSTFARPSSPRLYFSLSLQVTGLGPCRARCLTEASQKASGCLSHRTLLIILALIFILFVSPTCIFLSQCVFFFSHTKFISNNFPSYSLILKSAFPLFTSPSFLQSAGICLLCWCWVADCQGLQRLVWCLSERTSVESEGLPRCLTNSLTAWNILTPSERTRDARILQKENLFNWWFNSYRDFGYMHL